MIQKINIAQKFELFSDHWNPRIIAELNGQSVKLAKLKGEFIWHQHDHEDEMFMVFKGQLTMQLREGDIVLNEGEMIVIPAGTEHRPVAVEEVFVLLFEPMSTLNTGDLENEMTRNNPEWI
jgi:mannose-6-phosphate isomerase-like protein (cupin superfamily)